MLSLRMRSGSWGGAVRSTISIAGEMPAIAALAVSPSASAGTSRPICTAISGSSTGFDQPANDTLPPDCTRAFRVKKPTSGAEMLRSCNIAGAPKPTFQPSGWSPASRRLRRAASCACMPRTTRGSSQSFMVTPAWWASSRPAQTLMRLGIDFVAGRLDGARAHPPPHQHDVLVRGVVEAVPARARRIDDVAFARRLLAVLGVDMALALEHDEELIAVMMAMVFMPCTGFQNGPADHMVGAGGLLVDQELHLHVDPAILALEASHLRHVLQVGAIHPGGFLRRDFGRRALLRCTCACALVRCACTRALLCCAHT